MPRGHAWSEKDTEWLVQLVGDGKTTTEIAEIMGRSHHSVDGKLRYMGEQARLSERKFGGKHNTITREDFGFDRKAAAKHRKAEEAGTLPRIYDGQDIITRPRKPWRMGRPMDGRPGSSMAMCAEASGAGV